MSGFDRVIIGVTTVVPGPAGTVTFVRQTRGPYAGSWLLPGGKAEFGESLADAARREVYEEVGCLVEDLDALGVYELRGTWHAGQYHLIMFGFVSHTISIVPEGFIGDGVGEILQSHPDDVPLHPAVHHMLYDAGLISVAPDLVNKTPGGAAITLDRHLFAS
jgi:8-oxo-dGTP diphosphatase